MHLCSPATKGATFEVKSSRARLPVNMSPNGKSHARYQMNATAYGYVFLSLILSATSLHAADWPSWGGQPSRNMASEAESGLPAWYALGGIHFDPAATQNIKWVAKLGDFTGGSPIVSAGRVFIGTKDGPSDDEAILLCLDEQTGRELGRFICQRPSRHVEHWGVCSTPTVDGDRLYVVTPYGEAVCVNVASWLASHVKASAEDSDRHIVWKYDMVEKLHVEQDHTASCSPLALGDFVYVCTGNGRFKTATRPLYPLTPSLIALNKHTGQLVTRDDEQIGEQLWRGQWSSPSAAMVNGKTQILFATGNGLCYGFEPVDRAVHVASDKWVTQTLRGPIVYYIDVKGKDIAGLTPAQYATVHQVFSPNVRPALPLEFRYTIGMPATTPIDSIPEAQVPDVPILKKVWWFDCLPAEYRNAPFYAHADKGDGKIHPCDIIATPVSYRNRVYVAIGGDPRHGSKGSRGRLVCFDATKSGDVTRSGLIWSYDKLNATLTTVAIADGLLFVIDEASVVHCLDADSGREYWTYELKSDRGLLTSALVVADGKVFVGKSILSASRILKILSTIEGLADTSCSTPCVANGVLFTVHGKRLWAVCNKGDKKPQASSDTPVQ
jgi:outer membrane protein assembly factor BamB